MPQSNTVSASALKPARSPYLIAILSWLIPGCGHFMLGRRMRGGLIAATVLLSFVTGLLMQGPMFEPGGSDVLTRLIHYGGFIGDLAAGVPYLLAVWLGYSQPDVPGSRADYGSKFIVAAGLLNILAIVDAWEIATNQKD